jgi:glycosyltransferase involved in cell wall biosynthesis
VKILILCEGDAETLDSWSGISKSVVEHLRAAGHTVYTGDVDLYGLTRIAALLATWSPRRFRWWVRYHLGAWPFKLRSRQARRSIRSYRDRIDLVLQFGATFEPAGLGSIPYMLYCDGNARLAERGDTGGQAEVAAFSKRELQGVIRREAAVYEGAAGIMTLSKRLRQSFIEDFCIPADKVIRIGAGPNIGLDQFSAPETPRGADAPPTILFVGRNFERKGGGILLQAFRSVRERIPGARLLIAGPPSLQVDEPGVKCLGFLRKGVPREWGELRAAYASADVFCLPTRFEPFGIVFVEAMLFGLPCIGPDAWAVPEIIEDGVTGVLVPPDDAPALADALVGILSDPGLARRMGRAGRDRALREFTWSAVVNRMEAVMGSVEANGPGPSPPPSRPMAQR